MAGPSHVDLSVLWVPIMPETSKLGPAMEEAGKDATESFDKGTVGLGDKIHDSFTKATGKVKDVFHKAGNDASESMADGVKEQSGKVEDALEDTGKKAHSKFRDAVGDIGKEFVGAISPDVKRQLSERVEDVVGGAFKSAFGDEGIAGMVGGAVSKAAGEGFGSWIDSVKDKVSGVKDTVNTTKAAFADLTGGKTAQGLVGLSDSFGKMGELAHKFGIEVSDLPKPLQDVVAKTNDAKVQAQQFAAIFTGMPGIVGKLGVAIGELAGPLALVVGLSNEMYQEQHASNEEMRRAFQDPALRAAMEHRESGQHPFTPAVPDKPLPPMDMTSKTAEAQLAASGDKEALRDLQLRAQQGDQEAATLLRDNNLSTAIPAAPAASPGTGPLGSWFGGPGRGHGPIPSAPSPSAAEPPAAVAPSSAPSSFVGSMPSTFSSPADLHAGGSKVANLYAVAQSLQGTPYSQQIRNDCSGMVSKLATAALGMSPSVQFSTQNEGQWLTSHGFQPGMGGPNDLNIGWYNHGSDPNSGHTAATLPGGINAESGGGHGFQLGGSVGAGSSQFDQHAHLAMDGSSGGLSGGAPTGAQHDPLYIMPADSGGSGGGSSQDQAQQLGSGFLDGLMQSVGLDGSVFKGFGGSSNPLHFGITKLATGLINTFAGGAKGGDGASGGGGGIPGLGALGSLIPSAAHGVVPTGPGGAQNVRTGETVQHNYYGPTGPQLNVTQNGVQSPTEDLHGAINGAANRMPAYTAPNGGGGPTPA